MDFVGEMRTALGDHSRANLGASLIVRFGSGQRSGSLSEQGPMCNINGCRPSLELRRRHRVARTNALFRNPG